jgi:3-isopropylmalate dehydrogenase
MTTKKIALLDGDGIGPEIMAEAVKILDLVAERNAIEFELVHGAFGASAYFSHGDSFPEETKALCDSADAILKGPIGLNHEESKKIRSICSRSVARYYPFAAASTPLPTFAPCFSHRALRTFPR